MSSDRLIKKLYSEYTSSDFIYQGDGADFGSVQTKASESQNCQYTTKVYARKNVHPDIYRETTSPAIAPNAC